MHRAVFYEFHGGDLTVDRIIYQSPAGDVTILLAGDPAAIPPMAAKLAEEGVNLIELCGGLPLAYRAKVKEAAGASVLVASVAFGIESIVKAAEFNNAFMAGKPPPEACILHMPGADPATDRFVRHSGPQHTTFIMSDESAAIDVAAELAGQGVGLIELYGSWSDHVTAEIIEILAGRAAVGVSGFGHGPIGRQTTS